MDAHFPWKERIHEGPANQTVSPDPLAPAGSSGIYATLRRNLAWRTDCGIAAAAEGVDSASDFVDQLDLDGDSVAEVFVQPHGFDAYGYASYRKSAGRWREIYTATGDAC